MAVRAPAGYGAAQNPPAEAAVGPGKRLPRNGPVTQTASTRWRDPKSQTKSQRPQTRGVTRLQPATVVAGRCHTRRQQATSSDGKNLPYKRGVTGSNPVAPTKFLQLDGLFETLIGGPVTTAGNHRCMVADGGRVPKGEWQHPLRPPGARRAPTAGTTGTEAARRAEGSAASGRADACCIVVSLMTGLRPEEARASSWEEDVDLDGNPPSVAVLRADRAGGETP